MGEYGNSPLTLARVITPLQPKAKRVETVALETVCQELICMKHKMYGNSKGF